MQQVCCLSMFIQASLTKTDRTYYIDQHRPIDTSKQTECTKNSISNRSLCCRLWRQSMNWQELNQQTSETNPKRKLRGRAKLPSRQLFFNLEKEMHGIVLDPT